MSTCQQHAERCAIRMREVMAAQSNRLMEEPGVYGAGVGWRNGDLAFVIMTDSIENAKSLRGRLPATIEGFPLVIDMATQPATTSGATEPRPVERSSYFRRLFRFFVPERDWLAFAASR